MALRLPLNNIILTGFMGCGKSYFSTRLAEALGFSLKDTDQMIEEKAGRSIKDIFVHEGEDYFRRLEAEIADDIKQLRKHVIATGGGFPIYYRDIIDLGTVIYMDMPFEEILKRMSKADIAKRPLFSDLKRAHELFKSREALYKERSHFQLDATQSIEKMIEDTQLFLDEE